jgi:hypothetical protein
MHHTKQKGDIGLTQIIADLTMAGFNISLPLGEHLRYDAIIEKNGSVARLQCKYKTAEGNTINIKVASSWSNSKGCHVKARQIGDFDILGCFCPETGKCYYISDNEFGAKKSVALNTGSSINNRKIKYAEAYISCDRAFDVWLSGKDISHKIDLEELSKDKILDLKRSMTWSEIGYIYEVTGNTIRNRAIKLGVDPGDQRITSSKFSEYRDDIKKLNAQGLSQRKIANEVGCSRGNVEYILKQLKEEEG